MAAAIITALTAVLSTLATQFIKGFFENRSSKLEKDRFNITILRHFITSLYYQYKDEKAIPAKQKEDALYLYDLYTSLGGNSYVHSIIEEIEEWRVV